MLKIALIFIAIGMFPLFLSKMRFKITENDTPEQKIIKENIKKTQLVIATVFFIGAVVLGISNFIVTDQSSANAVLLVVYAIVVVGTIAFALIRQVALQKVIRQMMKK